MTTKGLELILIFRINIHVAVAEFEKIDNCAGNSTVGKMVSNSIACYRESFCERKSQPMWQILYFISRNCPSRPSLQDAATTLISQQPSALQQAPLLARRF